jgi:predicted metal-dependent hydrolase
LSVYSGRSEWWDFNYQIDVRATAIYIRPVRHKWADCSTAGAMSFNDELIAMDRELGDYVFVHELLQFLAPNHCRLWISLMSAHLGDYEALEQRLSR